MSNVPAEPVPAATILMLRDGPDGLEVFMVVRHHEIDFASGALVFPGGKADPDDFDEALAARLDGAARDPNLRAIQVAAIREAFEECGILLASPRGSAALVDGSRLATLEPYRDRLHAGELTIGEFIQAEDLVLACNRLVHFSHWITPTMVPKRFDTHFFLALAPPDHIALHDGHESVDSTWVAPRVAVDDAEAGRRTVIFPTLRNLEKLALHANAAAALDVCAREPVVTVLPWTEPRADGTYLCIPENAGYQVTAVRMPARG
jgi:8-oxo-dGTP pyrophosphatase MutT (NUDIX family)